MKLPSTGELYGRSVEEWQGKTPDAVPPMHVQLRVFKRQNGLCALTRRKIRAGDSWDCDHIKRLSDGGKNVESNLQAVLTAAHIEKTASENSAGKKADRTRLKHTGKWPRSPNPIRSRGFQKRDYVEKDG